MLRLFAHLHDHYLKVREVMPGEDFTPTCTWRNEIEFAFCESPYFMIAWPSYLPDLPPEKARALVEFIAARYPMSPEYQSLKAICPKLVYQDDADEWVFFGGSFNPWHKGHQACLDLLPRGKVCFVLPDHNPHKEMRNYELVSSVIEHSAKTRFHDGQFFVPTFLVERAKNPTVIWMEKLKAQYPQKKFSLLMGFDSFSTLGTWTRVADLLKQLTTIYVVSRMENEKMREKALTDVKNLGPHLDVQFLGNHAWEELSSSEIRRRF